MNENAKLAKSCTLLLISFPLLALLMFVFSIKQTVASGTPIVLDISGNGKIDITGHTTTRQKLYTLFSIEQYVKFDIFNRGEMSQIDWIAPDTDAFLIDLREGHPSGNLTGKHLFGTAGFSSNSDDEGFEFENGFEKLATLDLNQDGKLSGDELTGLALWKDDGDALFEPNEHVKLSDHKIVSISVTFEKSSGAYGAPKLTSEATTESSSSIYVEDIWFMTPNDVARYDRIFGRFFAALR
ncbi:MAG: hypothetical protein ABJK39_13050 [Hyphomicrobiales bacterium]